MINGIQIKVCGLTNAADAAAAAAAGADFLGFILWPSSPRAVSLERFEALRPELPGLPPVAVMVEPGTDELLSAARAGFRFLQVHFRMETPEATIAGWSRAAGPGRLWLAPKLPPQEDVRPEWLPFARTFLLDTFSRDGFGGSGITGDWAKFQRHQASHPGHTWILAGGLGPGTIAAAIAASSARRVDVNSGVETEPGRKDHDKLAALRTALESMG